MTSIAGARVLVAEDDRDIRELVTRSLEGAGYDIVAAADGDEALRLVHELSPAVAVLDVSMPGLDGYELTRRLRRDPATQNLPILLVTARARPGDLERGLEAGASGYLTKPFSPGELRARVEELLAP